MSTRDTLGALASNLWWAWSPRAQGVFERLAPDVWAASNHSPSAVLLAVTDAELEQAMADADLSSDIDAVAAELATYLSEPKTWCRANAPSLHRGLVAYFSAEFGIHESLPIYSGGLGVLAGDHIKTASDLGIPFVGVSLKYDEGYFQQRVDANGWQQEYFPATRWEHTPVKPTLRDGRQLRLMIPLAGRKVGVDVFEVAVGRSTLYLLDTDVESNTDVDRAICRRLYGGDSKTRIRQETVLGIGGVRLLRALGLEPSVYHLNEGHSAFACVELIRERVGRGDSYQDALHWVRQRTLFTTHTPVAAGHDRFDPSLVTAALGDYQYRLGTAWHDIIGLGRVNPDDHGETFCMTVLALKTAAHCNGVSRLHGQVSREMWVNLWPGSRPEEVPISHITNGIHAETFMHPIMRDLVEERMGASWNQALIDPGRWADLSRRITEDDLRDVRVRLKQALFDFLTARLQRTAFDEDACASQGLRNLATWRTDALTIGFARRFATYKRGDLIFSDFERAVALLASDDRPIQLLIAGKAHPSDDPGKEIIQRVLQATRDSRLAGRVIFVENYDMAVGRALTSGVDVWLNNPRRPREASGTSGEKVPLHGGVNLSILDGWWVEGFRGDNGYAIGDHEAPRDTAEQDRRDLAALYEVLETQLLPDYYAEPGPGRSPAWLAKVRASFSSLSAQFSTRRMLRDYATHYYDPITANQR
ncbi:MAG: alpha-glucan family phosphorylase [Myxococcales bacterium]|nr:alpha-glucan family phosphorylase [Myxococcales bacterium]